VHRLQLLLALSSEVIHGSESRGTREHISLSQILDFTFRRLLGLAGLRRRYSTSPPHGRRDQISESESELLYDWRFTANQFVLALSPLRLTARILLQLNTFHHSPYLIFSLTRGWTCRLQLLLVLASALIPAELMTTF
jgi:hypothetical protein